MADMSVRVAIVPEYPGLVISADGRIQGPSGRWLKGWVNRNGYRQFRYTLSSGRRIGPTFHTVVCTAFHGPRPEGLQVRHLNGAYLDNRADNLKWGTVQENQLDRRLHGTSHLRGEDHKMARFTEEQVRGIREALAAGERVGEIALRFGSSRGAVDGIRSGRNWGWLA